MLPTYNTLQHINMMMTRTQVIIRCWPGHGMLKSEATRHCSDNVMIEMPPYET